jgi:threonylcarbamoyladenosine tRNA methylthiotransferase MtaB
MLSEEVRYGVYFETLGCRLNQIESEGAAASFARAGFLPFFGHAPDSAETVLCVVNTCAVTGKAEQKARRLLRLLLETHPASAALVTGCYAQLAGELLAGFGRRVAVLPGKQKSLLADIPFRLMAFLRESGTGNGGDTAAFLTGLIASASVPEESTAHDPFRLTTDTFFAHSRSLVKIQDGCDNACSYCAIRLARGKSVSLDAEQVIGRIRALEGQGQREVVLTGVNLCQYAGKYRGRTIDLTSLLGLILGETSAIALRISSLYPGQIDRRLCAVIRSQRVRPHFHLSVQSGSGAILRAMNRRQDAAGILEAVSLLRAAKENPFIACDIIAGFPGETDGDFEETLALCRACGFAWIHAFPFSARPGTPAFYLPGAVRPALIRERAHRLADLAAAGKIAYINSFAGKSLSAIIEHPGGRAGASGQLRGVTENFIHVELPAEQGRTAEAFGPGREARVRILSPLEERIRGGDETEALAEFAGG